MVNAMWLDSLCLVCVVLMCSCLFGCDLLCVDVWCGVFCVLRPPSRLCVLPVCVYVACDRLRDVVCVIFLCGCVRAYVLLCMCVLSFANYGVVVYGLMLFEFVCCCCCLPSRCGCLWMFVWCCMLFVSVIKHVFVCVCCVVFSGLMWRGCVIRSRLCCCVLSAV